MSKTQTPNGSTWEQRFSEALSLLCGGAEVPPDMVTRWFSSDDERLQHWASEHGAFAWHQGIALIDAAALMADTPSEGEGHLERVKR